MLLVGTWLYGCSSSPDGNTRVADGGNDTSTSSPPDAESLDTGSDRTTADATDEDVAIHTDMTASDAGDRETADAKLVDSDASDAEILDADAANPDVLDADASTPDVLDADASTPDVLDADASSPDVLDADASDQDVVDQDATSDGSAIPTFAPDASTDSVLAAFGASCVGCAADAGCDMQGGLGDTCDTYSGADRANCLDVLACEIWSGCDDLTGGTLIDPCYCGTLDLDDCSAGTGVPNGPCAQQILAAFGDASGSTVFGNLIWQFTPGSTTTYPGGSAGAIASCADMYACGCTP